MNDLLSDKSKVFSKIKDIISESNFNVQKISSELELIKELKDLKSVVDFVIREEILENVEEKDIDRVKSFLRLSTELARRDLSSAALPFVLFSDVLNALTIQRCERFFSFMEDCILQLRDTAVFVSGRALLLRICNDLLRRLSKSQNTVFCGKIQIFLSRLFPLDEKSGLNLMGHFNTDNLTPFNDTAGAPVDGDNCSNSSSAVEEISIDLTADDNSSTGGDDAANNGSPEINSIMKVNKGFYRKFWILQDFFRNSAQIYEDGKYASFSASVDEVLAFFSKFRVSLDHSSTDQCLQAEWSSFSNADMTFTKYLTSEKLFDLQLMDPNFRRCVLVQLAVTFQYLLAPIKFKTPEQVLKEDQLRWVERQQVELGRLLQVLSSDREPFADIVRLVLSREAHKSNWKNDGCPSFVKKRPAGAPAWTHCERELEKRKCRIKTDASGRQVPSFDGNPELSRLWRTVCADNLAACREPARASQPDLNEYFSTARLEMDPTEKVEEKYRLINDERWCWASLRLLSRRSQHFYTNWLNPGQPIKQYLTTIIMDKLLSPSATGSVSGSTAAATDPISVSVSTGDVSDQSAVVSSTDDITEPQMLQPVAPSLDE